MEERTRPDDVPYFIKPKRSDMNANVNANVNGDNGNRNGVHVHEVTFEGWKEDYVFTTRDGMTGYFWDGMDSFRKLLEKGNSNGDGDDNGNVNDNGRYGHAIINNSSASFGGYNKVATKKVKTKKKKKKKQSKDENVTNVNANVNTNVNTNAGNVQTDAGLPMGWSSAVDPSSNKTYYYNVQLNQTVWEKPKSAGKVEVEVHVQHANNASESAGNDNENGKEKRSGLQAQSTNNGWEEAKDPNSGKTYYFHRALNKTTWERPF